jgi:prolyl-tRNA synthetase
MAVTGRDTPKDGEDKLEEVKTPDVTAVEDVAAFLNIDTSLLVKTLVYLVRREEAEDEIVAACVRGDDVVQEVKLMRQLGAIELVLASGEEIATVGGVAGFVGPQGLGARVIADESLKGAKRLVAGANALDKHVQGLDMSRDVPEAVFADIRAARPGDHCVKCGSEIELSRGIEVGHVFELGRAYSEPMGVAFQDQDGKRAVATMGCYGIGVSRLVAAVVEQCHDEAGIIWPMHLAPFHVVLISLGQSAAVMNACQSLYEDLNAADLSVLWDERAERPGVKFKDAELMGFPMRIVIGERSLALGQAEFCVRGGEKLGLPIDAVVGHAHAEYERRLS